MVSARKQAKHVRLGDAGLLCLFFLQNWWPLSPPLQKQHARLEQRHEYVGHELYVLAPEVHAHKVRQRARKLHTLHCIARSSINFVQTMQPRPNLVPNSGDVDT